MQMTIFILEIPPQEFVAAAATQLTHSELIFLKIF